MLRIEFADLFTRLAAADPLLIALGILFILLLCGFGFPLPEDIILIFTGYVCHLGILPFWLGIAIGMGGVLLGDSALWWIGHRYGQDVLKLRLFRSFLPRPRQRKIEKLYVKYGTRMLIGARFSPGIRAGVFLFSGISGVTYRRFILTDGSAALLSVPAIVSVAYVFGDQIDRVLKALRGVQHYILLGLVLIILGHLAYSWLIRLRERRQMELAGANGSGQRASGATALVQPAAAGEPVAVPAAAPVAATADPAMLATAPAAESKVTRASEGASPGA